MSFDKQKDEILTPIPEIASSTSFEVDERFIKFMKNMGPLWLSKDSQMALRQYEALVNESKLLLAKKTR